jgi:hypothetical protein
MAVAALSAPVTVHAADTRHPTYADMMKRKAPHLIYHDYAHRRHPTPTPYCLSNRRACRHALAAKMQNAFYAGRYGRTTVKAGATYRAMRKAFVANWNAHHTCRPCTLTNATWGSAAEAWDHFHHLPKCLAYWSPSAGGNFYDFACAHQINTPEWGRQVIIRSDGSDVASSVCLSGAVLLHSIFDIGVSAWIGGGEFFGEMAMCTLSYAIERGL